MKKTLTAWLIVVAWCSVIFFFSSLPTIKTPFVVWWDVLLKKTAHISEFGILFMLLFRALKLSLKENNYNILAYKAVFISVVYAFSDEFHQRFTPGRTSTIRDVVIDTIGIILSAVLIYQLKIHKNKFEKLYKFVYAS